MVFYETDAVARDFSETLFELLDMDNGGFIDLEEMYRARAFMTRRLGSDNWNLLAETDADGNGRIDMDEWHTFCAALYEVLGKARFYREMKLWIEFAEFRTQGRPETAPGDPAEPPEKSGEVHRPVTAPAKAMQKPSTPPAEALATSHLEKVLQVQTAETLRLEKEIDELKRQATAATSREEPQPGKAPQSNKHPARKAGKSSTEPAKHRKGGGGASTEAAANRSAAATKIQSVQRQRNARKDAEKRKHQKGSAQEEAAPLFKAVRVADLWDYLMWDGGRVRTSVPVGEVVNLYAACRDGGLNLTLPEHVPMHFTEKQVPENLSVEKVAHLCKLLLQRPQLSEEEARKSLEDHGPFPRDQGGGVYARMDGFFNCKRFSQLLSLISVLAQIDQQYIVLQLQFMILGVFEMTDTLAAIIIEHGKLLIDDASMKRRAEKAEFRPLSTFDNDMPDESVLQKKLELDTFCKLMYNGGIVDPCGEMLKYADLALVYNRAVRNMSQRLEARATKQKRKIPKGMAAKAEDEEIMGRLEFEILFEELYDVPDVKAMFPTPLKMAVHFARKAKEAQAKEEELRTPHGKS